MSERIAPPVPDSPPAPPSPRFEMLSSLQYRDYRFLWLGNCILSAGQQIQMVTLGWLLYDMTSSSFMLGLLSGIRTIPVLIIGPLAGVITDRSNRRRTMMQVEGTLAATALIMGVLVMLNIAEPWHVFVFGTITGVGWVFVNPIRQALVPMVVPRSDLGNAIALNSTGFNLSGILGPVFGGVLIASLGAAGNFFAQGVAYAGVVVMVYLMHIQTPGAASGRASALHDLKEGFTYVWKDPMILALMTTAAIPNLFGMPLNVLLPVFQKDVLQVGPPELGMMLGAMGVGAVISTLIQASFSSRIVHKGQVMLLCLLARGVLTAGFALTTSFPLALVFLMGIGGTQNSFMLMSNTILQLIVPNQLRGRVMSTYFLVQGVGPIGALFAGAAATAIGAPTTVAALGVLITLFGVYAIWRNPELREWNEQDLVAQISV